MAQVSRASQRRDARSGHWQVAMIKEKKSTQRRSPAQSKKSARNMHAEVSGGVDLEAENVQIDGDVVGRDKIVSNVEGDIFYGDYSFKVNNNYGTIVNTPQAKPQVRPRTAIAQPPRTPRGFVDREAELAQLDQWIAANEAITVFAPDGEGKSALLERAATRHAALAMPHGVVTVKGVDESGEALGLNDVIQCVFDALFESDPPLKANATNARAYLSNTQPLVIFDGLNLLATSVETLVNLIPKGALLFTATHLPAGNATQPLKLGPLPREEAIGLLAVRASVALDNATQPALEALCAALEDMPLAILVAADVIRMENIPLERARALITSAAAQPGDPIPNGIKRIWALLHAILSDNERPVLAAAATSPGVSVDLDWLRESIGNAEWADAAIERLKTLGLLHANSPRLRVDPGLRDLARAGVDEIAIKDRLIDYFKTTLTTRSLDWNYCAAELGNILGTIEWAAQRQRWGDVIALSRGIDPYLTLHGLWDAWQTILNRVLQAARTIGDRANEAWALHQLGTQAIGVEQTGQAIDFLRQALDLRRALGDMIGAAYTQHNLDQIIPPSPSVKPNGKPPASGGSALKSLLLKMIVVGAAVVGGLFLWSLLAGAFPSGSPVPTPASILQSPIGPPTPTDTSTPSPTPRPINTATKTPTHPLTTTHSFKIFLPAAARGCQLKGTFIKDVTYPNGSELAPNQTFIKTWRVMNNGTCPWEAGSQLVYVGGARMGGPSAVKIPTTAPGQTIDISVTLQAPGTPGDYIGNWQLRANTGVSLLSLSIVIKVPAPPTLTPPPAPPPLQPPGPQPPSTPTPFRILPIIPFLIWTPAPCRSDTCIH